MLTWFGPVFVLFLSEIGLPKTRIGILLSFLPFFGVIALVIAPAVARAGVRRVFLVCWGLRKGVTALLLLTPWVVQQHGAHGAFLFVGGLIALFATLRAVGETAWYPWEQELVPAAIRGRSQGVINVVTLCTSSLALGAASYILEVGAGLQRFVWLIGIVPLFMKEQVGLPGSRVVLLEVSAYVCGVLSSYLWGTWTDRAGSRPLVPILVCMALVPVLWMMMPRQQDISFVAALAIAALAGIATTGWWVADQRLLYVDVVPPEKRTEYMAIYYAWIGLVGGCGPLIAGRCSTASSICRDSSVPSPSMRIRRCSSALSGCC